MWRVAPDPLDPKMRQTREQTRSAEVQIGHSILDAVFSRHNVQAAVLRHIALRICTCLNYLDEVGAADTCAAEAH